MDSAPACNASVDEYVDKYEGDDGPWSNWDRYIDQLTPTDEHKAMAAECASAWASGDHSEYVPSMPCVPNASGHRVKTPLVGEASYSML